MHKKLILIFANSLPGLFSFRIELIRRIIFQGYKVTICAPQHDIYTEKLIELGVTFIDTPINRHGTNPLTDLKLILRYINIINKVKPDIILTYTIKPNIYGGIAARICKIPQIANITGLGSAVETKSLLSSITTTLYKIAFKNINTIFFQNEANKNFFENLKLAGGNHLLIPGSGVNLEYHTVKSYPSEESPLKFIFISRVMKQKGIEEVLKASEYLNNKGIKAEFHILGNCEENYIDKINNYQSKGLIKYHGSQEDVRPFLASAHCLIHPSYYPEGMSNVVLEACAAGRPVITTDRPGCREPIENCVTGFIFPPQNTEEMFKQIDKFVNMSNQQRAEMGKKAREKMEREFDRNIVVNSYINEIQKIISDE